MDMSHQKLTNATWDPYNMAMEEHILDDHDHQTPFDHTQWSTINYPRPDVSNSSPTQLLVAAPNVISQLDHQAWNFKIGEGDQVEVDEQDEEELGAMKEMMFKIASMQPVDIDPATIRRPKRRNVRISDDPQSVAARHRRERISEKIRILQRLVPGGTKMDTASMLDEAIRYVKFLKRQIRLLQANHYPPPPPPPPSAQDWEQTNASFPAVATGTSYVFGGNDNINDEAGHDDPMCFNHKFIGHHH